MLDGQTRDILINRARIWETTDSNRRCPRRDRRGRSNNPIMDGNTTRINRILRRNIRLPILPTHNSHLARSNNRQHPAHSHHRDITRMGQYHPFRRASNCLSRIWARH
jgi:hypothetical protein